MSRDAGKKATLGMTFGGFSHEHIYEWLEPREFNGEPYFCTRCKKPALSHLAAGGKHRCRCHHLKRVKETKAAAMERRAHWLLKREFDPELLSAKAQFLLHRDMMNQMIRTQWSKDLDAEFKTLIYGGSITNNEEKK